MAGSLGKGKQLLCGLTIFFGSLYIVIFFVAKPSLLSTGLKTLKELQDINIRKTFMQFSALSMKQNPVNKDKKLLTIKDVSYYTKIFPPNIPLPISVTYPYQIENKDLCSKVDNLTYVLIVQSAPGNFDRRLSIRQTYGNLELFKGMNYSVVFMLANTTEEITQKGIYEESNKFGDIVQGGFLDSYHNLTLKSVLGFRWVKDNCLQAEFVIRVDDDVLVNIYEVITNAFSRLRQNKSMIICHVEARGIIGHPDKVNADFKWVVPSNYFPNMEVFPMPFCYGYAAFYSSKMSLKLFEKATKTPFFYLEDVYGYGILASQVKGISWYNEGDKFFKKEGDTLLNLQIKGLQSVWIGTARSAKTMNMMWDYIQKKRKQS